MTQISCTAKIHYQNIQYQYRLCQNEDELVYISQIIMQKIQSDNQYDKWGIASGNKKDGQRIRIEKNLYTFSFIEMKRVK